MSEATRSESDRGLRGALYAVALVGASMAVLAMAFCGPRPALAVTVGALVGVMNLWVIGLVVRGMLRRCGHALPWALVAGFKFCVLVAGTYALVSSGLVAVLPLAIGYGALPLGIVAAGLAALPAAGGEGRGHA